MKPRNAYCALVVKDDAMNRTGEGPEPAGIGGAVLVAEDNAINAMLLQTLLEDAGFDCTVVRHGRAAIEAARHRAYDLILMDIEMPGMDGLAAASAIRALGGHCADVAILAVTAHAMATQRDVYLRAGMCDHIAKPIDADRFLATVRQFVGAARLSRTAAAGTLNTGQQSASPTLVDPACLDGLRATMQPAHFGNLMTTYIEGDRARLAAIEALLARADLAAIQREAHDLKSTSGNFGAHRLWALASRLEQACQRRDHETVRLVVTEMIAIAPETWAAIRAGSQPATADAG